MAFDCSERISILRVRAFTIQEPVNIHSIDRKPITLIAAEVHLSRYARLYLFNDNRVHKYK